MKLGLMIVGGVIAAGLLLLALYFVLPSGWFFRSDEHRYKRAECRANLKTWFKAQREYMLEKDRYAASFPEVGFSPERSNRYAYFMGSGPVEDRSGAKVKGGAQDTGIGVDTADRPKRVAFTYAQLPPWVRIQVGLSGECPKCEVTMACIGQIDDDPTPDVWTVSTRDRKAPDGTVIPAGQPYNEINDLEH